jgi:hypothetical protein
MECPQVANGGDVLQLGRIAANILNKQLRTADKEWSSSLGVSVWLTTPHSKESLLGKTTRSLGLGRIRWINDLSERKLI